jgi:phosphate transport system substrate-binding protein
MIATGSISSRTLWGLCLFSIVGLAGCTTSTPGVNPAISAPQGIHIDGSSTVFTLTDAIAKDYKTTKGNNTVSIDVKFSGTTGGFRKFCAGETDISNASRPIVKSEMEACNAKGVRYIEIPVAFDALTIVVNSQNNWAKDITIEELKKVWEPLAQGKITNWKQIRDSYPDRPLTLYGAGKDSGTFDYFNEVTTGKAKESRTDYTASEDDNILAEGVIKDPNALGYFGLSYYEEKSTQLKSLAVSNGNDKGAILPSRTTVENATYRPFSRPLFIYLNAAKIQQKPELQEFILYYVRNAKRIAETVKFIPLPDEGYRLGELHFYRGKVGTAFDGTPKPDMTIGELLRKQTIF